MSSNSEEIVQQIRDKFEALLHFASDASTDHTPAAYEFERTLLHRLLEMGKMLLSLFFISRAKALRPAMVTTPEGQSLPYHSQKRKSYLSVFGKVSFQRSYYYQDQKGHFPLDALLNLPKKGCSDLLREWREQLAVNDPYHKAGGILATILGQKLAFSSRSLAEQILEDSKQVQDYYAQTAPPVPNISASILVVQADGKGVPMIKAELEVGKARRGKGQKAARKKEAIVTCVYTLPPFVRTPEEVVNSFCYKGKTAYAAKSVAGPQNKRWWATLSGKASAIAFTRKQVQSQEGPQIQHRVALTDGSEPLQRQVQAQLPEFTLILDLVHADEYLWEAANALLGERSPERTDWVGQRTLQMLSGKTQELIDELRKIADAPSCKTRKQTVLRKVAAYYERNLAFMRYDQYLAAGFPIATGVIEGACRHIVKDRCELSGMRWTKSGAEALLNLRCVSENGDFEAYHTYLRTKRRGNVHGVVGAQDERALSGATLEDVVRSSGYCEPLRLAA
jgi:hypothetical protein